MRTLLPSGFRLGWIGAAAVLGMLSFAACWLASAASVVSGHVAKTTASAVFVANREPRSVRAEELAGLNPLLPLVRFDVDRTAGEVRAHLFGLARRRAVFRPGLGCTLAPPGSALPDPPAALASPLVLRRSNGSDFGPVRVPDDVDRARLEQAVDGAFAEAGRRVSLRTRALLVLRDGVPIVERYGTGIDAGMAAMRSVPRQVGFRRARRHSRRARRS
jgi:hypothetical protein